MAWFRRKQTERDALIEAILGGELARRESETRLALRKLELEHEHLGEIAEQRRIDNADREKFREARREIAARAREERAKKKVLASNPVPADDGRHANFRDDCDVCTGRNLPQQSASLIIWHSNGHQGLRSVV
jgi:hypothetical protein